MAYNRTRTLGSLRQRADQFVDRNAVPALRAIPVRDAVSSGQFTFAILDGQLRIVCPGCHEPVAPGNSLGKGYSAAKTHVAMKHPTESS